MLSDLDDMAKALLTHLSQIIGKEKMLNREVQQAQDRVLKTVKRGIEEAKAKFLERPISLDKCSQALLGMGFAKAPGWDVLLPSSFKNSCKSSEN